MLLITGYRVDDSYFDYAESFLNNGISVEQLAGAMKLGKLGEQIQNIMRGDIKNDTLRIPRNISE